MKSLKTLKVVAAVIEKDQKIYATQRGYGDFKGGWEFPGGKVESGETYSEALKREIQEELNVEIEVNDHICTVEFDYPTFHLSMECDWCKITMGNLPLVEHEAAKWLRKDQLYSVDWLPADIEVVDNILQNIKKRDS